MATQIYNDSNGYSRFGKKYETSQGAVIFARSAILNTVDQSSGKDARTPEESTIKDL